MCLPTPMMASQITHFIETKTSSIIFDLHHSSFEFFLMENPQQQNSWSSPNQKTRGWVGGAFQVDQN